MADSSLSSGAPAWPAMAYTSLEILYIVVACLIILVSEPPSSDVRRALPVLLALGIFTEGGLIDRNGPTRAQLVMPDLHNAPSPFTRDVTRLAHFATSLALNATSLALSAPAPGARNSFANATALALDNASLAPPRFLGTPSALSRLPRNSGRIKEWF